MPWQKDVAVEYQHGWQITAAMPVYSLGVLTKRDALVVDFTEEELLRKVAHFADPELTDAACALHFHLPMRDKDCWDLAHVRETIAMEITPEAVRPIHYRPFDFRYLYDHQELIARRNLRVLRHLQQDNVALILGRQGGAVGVREWDLLFATGTLCDQNIFRRGGGTVFPLYLYAGDATSRRANFAPAFLTALAERLGMTFAEDGVGDGARHFTAPDVLHYLYALLHAPGYRQRYADFLNIDFPRIPLTGQPALFRALVELGARLLQVHLAGEQDIAQITFPIAGDCLVREVRYEAERLWVNATQYFDGIPPEAWAFHIGGFPILHKWLKERKGHRLSDEEVRHFRRMAASIMTTIALMGEIDELIMRNGGWPIE